MVRPESVKNKSKKQVNKVNWKSQSQKKVNHRPQLKKEKTKSKNMSKKVEKEVKQKSKVWLLALADYWSQEKVLKIKTQLKQKRQKSQKKNRIWAS